MNTLSLHDAALSYAERGFKVFPVRVLGKVPAIANSRGGNGFKDGTTHLPTVNAWWEKDPRYNIGLACVEPLLPFDIDTKNGGDETFARMCAEIGPSVFDGVPLVKTPGGRHFWHRQPEPPIPRHIGILPGIDLLGPGGYVIAPPSVRNDGSYVWTPEFADDAEELLPGNLPEFPRIVHDYLIAASTPKLVTPSKLVALPNVRAEIAGISDMSRNCWLASVAGTFVAKGTASDALAEILHAANRSACKPPLDRHEVDSIIKSAKNTFGPRYVEASFLFPWLHSDFGTADTTKQVHALRLLVLYAKIANEMGVAAPNESQVTSATGLSVRHYHAARMLLETAGAIVVQERGRTLTTLVVLQWKPLMMSNAA